MCNLNYSVPKEISIVFHNGSNYFILIIKDPAEEQLNTKRYTFLQKHVSGLLQRRLDYFYLSISMQVSVKNTDVLASLLNDHSPVAYSYCKNEESNRGRGFWKFNNSLIENEEYVHEMKKFISDTLNELFKENILGNI